ncbi:endonuclease/exonuclease/phosphatase family protein [Kitasatospora sp. DSM 101779]|uniref:endonuclease/exonuclease/phosphatase family protein n=1 Tax=Kitasatospora sp. DSM 101779 TaxID=2853165 RepID=UPI0021DAB571|nr:endonuclease/exonuclease/phosphatase family protein [Kitasatospora sp. DSM 101779]MCU7820519.1 endonuclease/exonuclease/phosphatase family protein [Kitasatospora sp. DSM 101779]
MLRHPGWLPALRRLPGRRRWLAAAAGTGALAVLIGSLPAGHDGRQQEQHAVPPAGPVIATWNMCDVRQWGCEETGTGEQKTAAIVRLAAEDGARVLLLQEVCSEDLEAARRALGADNWHAAFQEYEEADAESRRSKVPCGSEDEGEAGFAILSGYPLATVTRVPSAQPAVGLQRGILCASVTGLGLKVCNAHLSLPPTDRKRKDLEYRDDQLAVLAQAAAEARTVVGGDFNSAPPGPDNPDSWTWPATFFTRDRECDQSGGKDPADARPTHETGHKLDYLFTALPRGECRVRDTGVSDHRALAMELSTTG